MKKLLNESFVEMKSEELLEVNGGGALGYVLKLFKDAIIFEGVKRAGKKIIRKVLNNRPRQDNNLMRSPYVRIFSR